MARRHIVGLGLFVLGLGHSLANPTGGSIASGSATITTIPGTVTINQASNIAIINWQTFSISSGELTKFVQPCSTSAALNRVLGGQTVINGSLQANGQVYLINGNGIVVGPSGSVNTSSFVASTRDISDDDFLSCNYHFTGTSSAGVVNQGTITAQCGDVYLFGKTVDNQGTINAANGTAGLAAGDDVLLNLSGTEHVFVSPTTGGTSAAALTAVNNSGTISAASAELKAANGNLYALAINNQGTVRATAVAQCGGRVFLTTDTGMVQNNGTISAKSGRNGGAVSFKGGSVWNRKKIDVSGKIGGQVHIDSQNIQNDGAIMANGTAGCGGSVIVNFSGNALGSVSGLVDVSGTGGGGLIQFLGSGATSESYLSLTLDASSRSDAGGTIDINSPSLYLAGATLNANGAAGQGRIFVGINDPLYNPTLTLATTLYIGLGSTLSANATVSGNGGYIVAAGSGTGVFFGTASANGKGVNGHVGTIIVPSTPATPPVVVTSTGTGTSTGTTTSGGGVPMPAPAFEFIDPDAGANNAFGRPITGLFNLASNTTLITSPGDSFGGVGAGAAYLFSDKTGALLSTIRGSSAGEGVGTSVGFFNGTDFLISTPNWNGGAGALTFGNGVTGFANGGGTISATNSLVGAASSDQIGSGGLVELINGNFLILSPHFGGGAGAVTWVNPSSGITGVLGQGNSLVGQSSGDAIGSGGIDQLSNGGNYLVLSPSWGGGKGAITNGNDSSGVSGMVTDANSLVGASTTDGVGTSSAIIDSGFGYYLVVTSGWGNGAGAVTWNSSTLGTTGAISASNSLVGDQSGDGIGDGGINVLIDNHNYVVVSPDWHSETGAVTLGSGSQGVSGVVSASNSLIGAAVGDRVGSGGVTPLLGFGDFAVFSSDFNDQAGAVTIEDDTFGVTGAISASNSLIGANGGDQIGSGGITELNNGDILVLSPLFNGSRGAVTWGNPSHGFTGTVGSTNSLIGQNSGDQIGSGGILQLSNGSNYLVLSPDWAGGKGAITDANAGSAVTGTVTSSNSLVGANTSDGVGSAGSVLDPFTGYYLVTTADFNGGAGAVTWNDDSHGTTGVVGSTNSLVGSSSSDHVGSAGITILFDENYLVSSPDWNGNAGAVSWGSSSAGVHGFVSSSNSLVGQSSGDKIGSGGILQLSNGSNYLVLSPLWNGTKGAITNGNSGTGVTGTVTASNSLVGAAAGDAVGTAGTVVDPFTGYYLVKTANFGGGAGAVTWNDDGNGKTGVLSSSNSLVGSSSSDHVGSGGVTILNNGNYVVVSPDWNGDKGAVSWGSTSGGVQGFVGSGNSLVGVTNGDEIGSSGLHILSNGDYLVLSPLFNQSAGAVSWVDSTAGVTGLVSSGNSLVGATAGDLVGNGGIIPLADGNYVVLSPHFNAFAGAVTWGNEDTGVSGVVNSGNSLVGAQAGDTIGAGGVRQLSNGTNYLVLSPDFNNGAGAFTNGSDATGITGFVSASNSLVGGQAGDGVGSNSSILDDTGYGYYLITTAGFDNGAGAVTWNDDSVGTIGVISSANSLIGSHAGDAIGSGGITLLTNGNHGYVVDSPNWNGNAGAVTFGSASGGVTGVVGSTNSLVGASGGDSIGSGGITQLSNGNFLILSPLFNANAGAVTFAGGAAIAGVVSATNSLVGAGAGDMIGSAGLAFLDNGNYLVLSPEFGGGAGAVTFGSRLSGVFGTVSSSNSLVGVSAGDHIGGGGIIVLSNGNYLVQSPDFNGSAGAVTWGSAFSGVAGQVTSANSIVGGGPDSGEEYAGESADGTVYLISFTTDTSAGGDGRVLVGSVDGPSTTAAPLAEDFFLDPLVTSLEASGFNFLTGSTAYYIADPNAPTHDSTSVDSLTGGAINSGQGGNLAAGSSTSHASGPQRLVTPANGYWNIFGGVVHSQPPPLFIEQQLKLTLSPAVLAHLNDILFGHP